MGVQSSEHNRGDPYRNFHFFFINEIYKSLKLSQWADSNDACNISIWISNQKLYGFKEAVKYLYAYSYAHDHDHALKILHA